MIKLLGLVVFMATSVAFAQASLDDSQIAKVMITVNEGEAEAGEIAENKAQNKEVKKFGQMMASEHRKNIRETRKIAGKQKIIPKNSELSEALKIEGEQGAKSLKANDKAGFDKAYITQQIMMHEKVLNTLDTSLIPQAKNAEFKAHLEKTRASVATHLQHAKDLDTKIK